jgi:hypothetical protein
MSRLARARLALAAGLDHNESMASVANLKNPR